MFFKRRAPVIQNPLAHSPIGYVRACRAGLWAALGATLLSLSCLELPSDIIDTTVSVAFSDPDTLRVAVPSDSSVVLSVGPCTESYTIEVRQIADTANNVKIGELSIADPAATGTTRVTVPVSFTKEMVRGALVAQALKNGTILGFDTRPLVAAQSPECTSILVNGTAFAGPDTGEKIVLRDSTAAFLARAKGSRPMHYTWYRDSTIMKSGQNDSVMSLKAAPKDTGLYRCVIRSLIPDTLHADTSPLVRLKVNCPPSITALVDTLTNDTQRVADTAAFRVNRW
jgi:hypothetical protein